ncbi:MAG TPA: TlpA disulfide reductase family protein [Natronosporangium sp.]
MKAVPAAALAAALLLSGCTDEPRAPELPGPVPAGVTFHEPPPAAPAAPAFTLKLLDGRTLDLAEQWQQRPVVLVFFESFCSVCRDQQPELNEVAEQYEDIVLFVGIATESEPADVADYIAEYGLDYPVGIDDSGRTAVRYAVAEPPLVTLISKGGRLLRGWPAGVGGAELRDHIDRLAVADGG